MAESKINFCVASGDQLEGQLAHPGAGAGVSRGLRLDLEAVHVTRPAARQECHGGQGAPVLPQRGL